MNWNDCQGFDLACTRKAKSPGAKLCNRCTKRKQRADNPGKAAADLRSWRAANPEKAALSNSANYWSHRDLRLISAKVYYQKCELAKLKREPQG